MSLPVLKVDELSVTFPGNGERRQVVKSVSFQVVPGETLGIVGESGSGKSLTCLALAGLAPTGAQISGKMYFSGRLYRIEDLMQQKVRQTLPAIGIIFQESINSLNPLMKIGKQIAEAAMMAGETRRQSKVIALQLLRDVQIPEPDSRYHFYPSQLSGGMCQRVVIAMALAMRPALIIADEPTTALDVTVQSQVVSLLKSLIRERQIPMIFISHDLDLVSNICDRIVVMRHGEIVETGYTQMLCTFPQHPYTQSLLNAMPGSITSRTHLTTLRVLTHASR